MTDKRRKIFFLFLAVIFLFSFVLFLDFELKKDSSGKEEKRALLIVIENNFNIPGDLQSYYQNHKEIADIFFSFLFGINRNKIKDKSLIEITDLYFEDYLAERFKNASSGYSEVLVLSDESSSYEEFKDSLLTLSKENDTVDILLHLHGNSDFIFFYREAIQKERIEKDVDFISKKPLNIGYVYQTVCYGKDNMDIWLGLGAEVVCGSKEVNNFVVLAPEKFLRLWGKGESYSEAVNRGYFFEISVIRFLDKFIPGEIYILNEESLNSSKMFFEGNKNYKLEL